MFTRKLKTVAEVVSVLTKTIEDLDLITHNNMIKVLDLDIQRDAIDEQVAVANHEIAQVRNITNKLQNLLGQDVPL